MLPLNKKRVLHMTPQENSGLGYKRLIVILTILLFISFGGTVFVNRVLLGEGQNSKQKRADQVAATSDVSQYETEEPIRPEIQKIIDWVEQRDWDIIYDPSDSTSLPTLMKVIEQNRIPVNLKLRVDTITSFDTKFYGFVPPHRLSFTIQGRDRIGILRPSEKSALAKAVYARVLREHRDWKQDQFTDLGALLRLHD